MDCPFCGYSNHVDMCDLGLDQEERYLVPCKSCCKLFSVYWVIDYRKEEADLSRLSEKAIQEAYDTYDVDRPVEVAA